MNVPAKTDSTTVDNFLVRGDFKDLSPQERADHNLAVCKSLGLNWLTRPFDYIMLGGKLVFYAKKDATDQLRKINGISVEIVSQEIANGLLTVTAKATDKTGRVDTDIGVVPFNEKLAGEIAANMRMKAVTKAKRRVTLSISGLGFLDETEVESISDDDAIAEHDAPTDLDTPTGYKAPYKISAQSWRMFVSILETELRNAETKSDVFEWLKLNQANIDAMKDKFPKMYDTLQAAIEAIKAEPT